MNSHHVMPLLNFPLFSLIEFERIFNKSCEGSERGFVFLWGCTCVWVVCFGDSLESIPTASNANTMWAFCLSHLFMANTAKRKAAKFTRVKVGVLTCIWPHPEPLAFGKCMRLFFCGLRFPSDYNLTVKNVLFWLKVITALTALTVLRFRTW